MPINLQALDEYIDQDYDAHKGQYDRNRVTYAACSKEMIKTIKLMRERGARTHESIWNPCLFLNTVGHDLMVSLEDFLFQRNDEWKRLLFLRNLSMLAFEILEDLPAVFGKDFRAGCSALGVPKDLLDELELKKKEISKFKVANEKLFKEIRIVAGAHREHDAMLIHETIEKMDAEALGMKFFELGTYLNDLGKASQAIMTFTASVQQPEPRLDLGEGL